jgi:hypothetical protein
MRRSSTRTVSWNTCSVPARVLSQRARRVFWNAASAADAPRTPLYLRECDSTPSRVLERAV